MRSLICLWTLLCTGLVWAQAGEEMSLAEAKRMLKGQQQAFVAVAKQVTPAVVYIEVEREQRTRGWSLFPDFDDFFGGGTRKVIETGSGVIIRSDGLIVTNNHIVRGVDVCRVRLGDGLLVDGKVLGTDPATDIAVVKVEAKNLPALKWGDSDKLQVGEWVLAVGNPFGLERTVTTGIVSAKGRQDLGVLALEDFIQTDAAINPGNSGGALTNVDGELVGINSIIYTQSGGSQGIGFAVPSNMTRKIVDEIVRNGKVERGWIGFLPLRDNSVGARVYRVYRNEPADTAGLMPGDLIQKYGDKTVTSAAQLRKLVITDKPGSTITLTVRKQQTGQTETVRVRLGSVPIRDDGTPYPGI
ncbi:MAG: hypothetical protein AMXMBFR61_07050 [Fimbriimonadales bacterium]